ncbi:hypothetical protein FHN55_02225 [Streptomyces sp. NP160]|uniref:FxLYD domain-containing protein n=1 Tax=Streptomyces sp. NP160 TaxID=2586637 RepID=UPI001118A079|nr:FxLYD domain-containing protein [Streptomyces sp. NP160]TNM69608.1 hypothetical protein FHN55_02225 [Streptomyces sp. NP160]
MSDPTSRYPEQPRQPDDDQPPGQPPAYVPPPGYEEYAPRQQAPYTGDQPAYQQPYQQGYQGAPSRPTSVVAVIGLVLAFLLSPVGAVVSAFGIGDTRGGRKAGRGLAVAGVVVGVLGTLLWIAGILAAVAFVRSAATTVSDVASSLSTATELPSGLPSEFPSDLPSDLTDLPGTEDGAADVSVDSCDALVGGVATGRVTITNSTGAAASYVVNIDALDASGQEVGELYAVQDSVEPGQSVQAEAFGYVDAGADIASCEVSQAARTAG